MSEIADLQDCLDDLMHTNEGNDDWRKRIDTAVIAILKHIIDSEGVAEPSPPPEPQP